MPSLAYESLLSHSAFVSSVKLLTTRSKLLLITHLRNLIEIPISDFPSQLYCQWCSRFWCYHSKTEKGIFDEILKMRDSF
ncbi:hypothetical protein L1987_16901 [Smallanthus sonchifolius]|uniref:Uncharacterized protein n=1 Tax=Smallanthus sonchifolius TaxID=185202 RepID=A0ACB9IW97_9ASTR|nr:hypothetical protein L1987_16901 [Smallanthus sonchifolius]